MILVDTGPLVALFDPADGSHGRCVETLAAIEEPIATTVPVLTEAFHLSGPARDGSWISSPMAVCGFSLSTIRSSIAPSN